MWSLPKLPQKYTCSLRIFVTGFKFIQLILLYIYNRHSHTPVTRRLDHIVQTNSSTLQSNASVSTNFIERRKTTQPYVWSPAHRDAITWLLCYATAIGCQSNRASSTSCVWWYIAACTATHHLTWRTWSRRRPMQLSDLVSDSVAVPRTISSLGDRSLAAAGPRACMEQTSTTASSRLLSWYF